MTVFRRRGARPMGALMWVVIGLAVLLGGPLAVAAFGPIKLSNDWRTASNASTGLAPSPAATPEAVVQIYAARAFAWRGAFAVHTWLAVKPPEASRFTRYEVIGWNTLRGRSAVSITDGLPPDGLWFDAPPELIGEMRGEAAERVIAKLPQAVESYPYPAIYRAWPGPNSNTFTAHLGREIPELHLNLPPTALGKDFIPGGGPFARAPSGTGGQISAWGVVGLLAGLDEGLEVNLFGLVFGVDPLDLAIKLPGIGQIGVGGTTHAAGRGK